MCSHVGAILYALLAAVKKHEKAAAIRAFWLNSKTFIRWLESKGLHCCFDLQVPVALTSREDSFKAKKQMNKIVTFYSPKLKWMVCSR